MGIASRAGREGVATWDTSSSFAKECLSTINDGLSTFDPVLAETSYTWYCPDGGKVLDPFAGGSVRGLVAGNLGFDYTGIDLSIRQVAANLAQRRNWAEYDMLPGQVTWIMGDAAEALPRMPDGGFDYVLTCPPYFNLETYTDLPADLSNMAWDDFADAYRQIIAETVRCLAEHRFATWVVGEVRDWRGLIRGLIPLTIDAHREAGAYLYNDAVLVTSLGSLARRIGAQWRASRKMGRHHQYVLTFVKGDPKKATARIRAAIA